MIKLSVNVNKVATIRNSRGGQLPSVLEATRVCLEAGAPGVTVHPRADARHITERDVREVAALLRDLGGRSEFNIEGDPRPDLLKLVHELRPAQCTIVPVQPGEITSQAGWPAATPRAEIAAVVADLRRSGIRVSLFIDPDEKQVDCAAELGTEMIELHTGRLANAFTEKVEAQELDRLCECANHAFASKLQVNAGHGINYQNIGLIHKIPHLTELNIGHAIVSRAIFVGWENAVREMLAKMEDYRG